MSDPTILDELTPAMMTMETDVELPSGVRASSIVGNLIALKPGELYVYAQEIPSDRTLASIQEEAAALRYRMRNSVASSIRNAKRLTSSTFSLETAMVQMPTGRVLIQVVIQCVGEGSADLRDDDEV